MTIRLIIPVFFVLVFNQFCLPQGLLEKSNLPILVIDTQGNTIVDEPKINAHLGIINNDTAVNSIMDPFNEYDGRIGIEIRGSSSQFLFDKKSFGIETRDSTGNNLNVPLFGYPKENDWVLHGPFSDKSLIRNLLAMWLSSQQGNYAPRTKLCELIIDGDYRGVYLFMEKIKRDKGRVDISKLNPDEVTGDDVTGGYIVKIDKFDGGNSGNGWASPFPPPNQQRDDQVIFFQYDSPKGNLIVPAQEDYIKSYVSAFEWALSGSDFRDPFNGYRSFIDVDSFIDFLIMMELTRDVDGYRLSTFLYKDKDSKGGKMKIGPVWDFNLAFGNANYCNGSNISGWGYDFNEVCPDDFWLNPFWWNRFLQDVSFVNQLNTRWGDLRRELFSDDAILSFIDSVSLQLEAPQQRNFEQWPVLGEWIWPNNFVGTTYDSEIVYLKNWIGDRLTWLDEHFSDVITGFDSAEKTELSIFPNPFSTSLTLSFVKPIPPDTHLCITTTTGKQVANVEVPVSRDQFILPREIVIQMKKGIYLFRIQSKNKMISYGKLIKQ